MASASSSSGAASGGIHPPAYRLPSQARIGRVRLAVSDLQKSVDFYTTVIGLTVISEDSDVAPHLARLGAQGGSEALLELEALPAGHSLGEQKRLGLYHAAYLLPSREALSSFAQHLSALGIPFGASDHLYSEALYLADPDGFTVEVYADRPRQNWRFEGNELLTGVYPLALSKLPQVSPTSWNGAPQGTTIGHVHFFVSDLEQAKDFYHRGLGLDLMTWRYPGALFTSAGGYHHHVGLNIWAAASPRPSEAEPRLLFWELVLPHAGEMEALLLSMQREGFSAEQRDFKAVSVTDTCGIKVHLVTSE